MWFCGFESECEHEHGGGFDDHGRDHGDGGGDPASKPSKRMRVREEGEEEEEEGAHPHPHMTAPCQVVRLVPPVASVPLIYRDRVSLTHTTGSEPFPYSPLKALKILEALKSSKTEDHFGGDGVTAISRAIQVEVGVDEFACAWSCHPEDLSCVQLEVGGHDVVFGLDTHDDVEETKAALEPLIGGVLPCPAGPDGPDRPHRPDVFESVPGSGPVPDMRVSTLRPRNSRARFFTARFSRRHMKSTDLCSTDPSTCFPAALVPSPLTVSASGCVPKTVVHQIISMDPAYNADARYKGVCFLAGTRTDRLATYSFVKCISRFVRSQKRIGEEAKAMDLVTWQGKVQARMQELGLFCALTPAGVCEGHKCQGRILALAHQPLSSDKERCHNLRQVLTCAQFREEVVQLTRHVTEAALSDRLNLRAGNWTRLPYSKRSLVARNMFLAHVMSCGLV
jgi:hypothetical protein